MTRVLSKMNSVSFEKDYCRQKLDSILALIQKVLDTDFPHEDSRAALKQLKIVYEGEKSRLATITPSASNETVLAYCRDANVIVADLQNFLGMLVRSSNLRNAFEMFFPIKSLAQGLLNDSNVCLVLSSEWSFSPFTYPVALEELPEFIFIGLPASESENPLIVPLAGHELGHVVWRRKGAKDDFDPIVADAVLAAYRDGRLCVPRFLESRYLLRS